MVDFNSLNTATLETATRFHNFAKNIETAHLGNLYTTVIDGIDYYVVECAAKPLLEKAPEWLSDNRVVDSIKNHKGLSILAGGIITFIFIVIMLHPKGGVSGPGVGPTSPHSDDEKGTKLEEDDEKDKLTDPNLPKPTPSNSNGKKDANTESVDRIRKPKDNPSLNTNDEEDSNSKKTDGKGKSKDRTSSHSNGEETPLEEDSDIEEGDKTKDSEKKLSVNNNGDNVNDVGAGGKVDANNTNIPPVVPTLQLDEVHLEEPSKEENIPVDPLKATTDAEKKGSASDHEEDTQ